MFYQTQNEKAWLGPAEVKDVKKNWIWIVGNGDLRKVQRYKVKFQQKYKGKEMDEMVENKDS